MKPTIPSRGEAVRSLSFRTISDQPRQCVPSAVKTFVVVMVCLALFGCGTGQYDRTYNERMKELWRLEPFLALHEEANDILLSDKQADGAVSAQLRLPKVFDENAKRYDQGAAGDEPVDPERMLPPFASAKDLPGFRYSYERFVGKAGSKQLPVYVYLCATERRGSPFEQTLSTALRRAYKMKSSELSEAWQNEELASPEKSSIEWRRLQLPLAGQTFVSKHRDIIEKEELDGVIEVFIHTDGNRHVMFMMRMPKELENEIDLSQLAEAVAGTLAWSDDGEINNDE